MRQRREVAGGADRALARDHRIELLVEKLDEAVDDAAADAGVAAREGVDLQQQHPAHDALVERLADAAAMRQQEARLTVGDGRAEWRGRGRQGWLDSEEGGKR